MVTAKTGRNDPCFCGSGRKYKHCCAQKQNKLSRLSLIGIVIVLAGMTAVLFYAFSAEQTSGSRRVWDPDHGHYHTIP